MNVLRLLLLAIFKRKEKTEAEAGVEELDKFVDILRPPGELSGIQCAVCGSGNLLVCRDGSAICRDCKKAYQELVPPE